MDLDQDTEVKWEIIRAPYLDVNITHNLVHLMLRLFIYYTLLQCVFKEAVSFVVCVAMSNILGRYLYCCKRL